MQFIFMEILNLKEYTAKMQQVETVLLSIIYIFCKIVFFLKENNCQKIAKQINIYCYVPVFITKIIAKCTMNRYTSRIFYLLYYQKRYYITYYRELKDARKYVALSSWIIYYMLFEL